MKALAAISAAGIMPFRLVFGGGTALSTAQRARRILRSGFRGTSGAQVLCN